MFNLLSSVGGIDSSRFQKPQSMKDQRVGQSVPSEKIQAGLSSKELNIDRSERGAGPSQTFSGSRLGVSKASTAQSGPKSARKGGQGDTNSQLDSLLEGSLFNRPSRSACTLSNNHMPSCLGWTLSRWVSKLGAL